MRSLLLVFAVACSTASEPATPPPIETSGVVQIQIPMAVNRRLDVLFVIDSSPAMEPYVERMHANIRRFLDVLRTPTIPNIRFAVTSTGAFRGASGMTGDFLVDFVGDDANRQRNYDGDFADVIDRMISVGTDGPAFDPFAAAHTALDAHRGYVRGDSYLAIIFISASSAVDDPIAVYNAEQFFKSLQPDWQRMIFGAITAGDPRLVSLVEKFPDRNAHVSIDSEDWSPIWSFLFPPFRDTLGAPCIEEPLVDLERGCAAWYTFPIGGEVITPCADTPERQCWKLERDPVRCPYADGRSIEIENARVDFPEQVFLNLECLSR
jgi:hypothetical protein